MHFGSLKSAGHLPVHCPSHLAAAFILQLPPHCPLHEPSTCALHLPSHVPLHSAFEGLASHEPAQVPSHFALALRSHVPVHCASHVPERCPGSHSTFASPGLTVASHLPAQSAIALIDAWHS